jgi:hypothetical protein
MAASHTEEESMFAISRRWCARLGGAALILGTFGAAAATDQVAGSKAPSPSATKSRAASASFVAAPSGESQAARERRLRRECRGRPNAGMCLGFTR